GVLHPAPRESDGLLHDAGGRSAGPASRVSGGDPERSGCPGGLHLRRLSARGASESPRAGPAFVSSQRGRAPGAAESRAVLRPGRLRPLLGAPAHPHAIFLARTQVAPLADVHVLDGWCAGDGAAAVSGEYPVYSGLSPAGYLSLVDVPRDRGAERHSERLDAHERDVALGVAGE